VSGARSKTPDFGVGTVLYNLRTGLEMTISEFSDTYGISRSSIINIENGTRPVNNRMLHRLIDLFGYELFGQFVYQEQCRYCGEFFEPETGQSHFCSEQCAKIFHDRRGLVRLGTYKSYEVTGVISDLAKDNEAARKSGLSYGKYRALQRGYVL